MAIHVIHAVGVPAVRFGPRPRSRATIETSPPTVIRVAALVVLLALGLCGMVATAGSAVAGTPPPGGPQAGLDL